MCGRYYVEITDGEIIDIVSEAEKNRRETCGQLTFGGGEIFPGMSVPVVTERGALFMKWGFPSLSRGRPAHINTKSETALTLPTFRDAMRYRRCLIPATAYYEWKDTGLKRKKEKYEFFLPARRPFFIAGIFSQGKEFSILTREAADAFLPIHNRMPVVITRQGFRRWLSGLPPEDVQTRADFVATAAAAAANE